MIIYMCVKYDSNTAMYSKDIARKPFIVRTGRTYIRTRVMLYAPPPITNGGGITSTLANSEDPDEMPHMVAFHQGLHCLLG